jgi:hypothetical protein
LKAASAWLIGRRCGESHEPVTGDVDPLQVPRITLRGEVRAFAEHDAARAADRAAYLAKFPDAEPITALGDFA